MCIILIDWLNVTIWLNMYTFRNKIALLKVKISFKKMKRLINHWCELSTQNMKNMFEVS